MVHEGGLLHPGAVHTFRVCRDVGWEAGFVAGHHQATVGEVVVPFDDDARMLGPRCRALLSVFDLAATPLPGAAGLPRMGQAARNAPFPAGPARLLGDGRGGHPIIRDASGIQRWSSSCHGCRVRRRILGRALSVPAPTSLAR